MAKTTAKGKKDKTSFLVVSIVSVLGVILIGVWGTFQFGQVEGDEFSPDTFSRQKYSYLQIPLVRVQISGIDRSNTTGDLERHLVANKLIPVATAANPEWHTIQATAGNVPFPPGDAAILFRYLEEPTAPEGQSWLDWTTKNPAFAKVLWPVVAQLARDQLYIFLPDLFDSVARIKDPTEFATWVNHYAADRYTRIADARSELGRHNDAVTLYKRALSYQSDHTAATKGLAAAEAALKSAPAAEAPPESAPGAEAATK